MKSRNGPLRELEETPFFGAFKAWQALSLSGTRGPRPRDQSRRRPKLWPQEPARKVPLSGPSEETHYLPGLRPLDTGPVSSQSKPSPCSNHVALGKGKSRLTVVPRLLLILSRFPPLPATLCLWESYWKAWPGCHLLREARLDVPLPCQSESVTPSLCFLCLGPCWWVLPGP